MPVRTANCLIWAVCVWWKVRGQMIVRPSISRWRQTILGREVSVAVPHFLVGIVRGRYRHIVSFTPIVRPERPSLIYMALFEGRMVWGDAHAPPSRLELRHGAERRYALLKAAAVVAIGVLMVVVWLAWWIWRIAGFAWEVIAFAIRYFL